MYKKLSWLVLNYEHQSDGIKLVDDYIYHGKIYRHKKFELSKFYLNYDKN